MLTFTAELIQFLNPLTTSMTGWRMCDGVVLEKVLNWEHIFLIMRLEKQNVCSRPLKIHSNMSSIFGNLIFETL